MLDDRPLAEVFREQFPHEFYSETTIKINKMPGYLDELVWLLGISNRMYQKAIVSLGIQLGVRELVANVYGLQTIQSYRQTLAMNKISGTHGKIFGLGNLRPMDYNTGFIDKFVDIMEGLKGQVNDLSVKSGMSQSAIICYGLMFFVLSRSDIDNEEIRRNIVIDLRYLKAEVEEVKAWAKARLDSLEGKKESLGKLSTISDI